ncbi:MAG: hypothetical protein ACE5JD_10245, partial [Candidatus Methylomirabilia bacterium]
EAREPPARVRAGAGPTEEGFYRAHALSEPMTSWGVLISEGANAMSSVGADGWLIVFPGVLFVLTLYWLNAVGDGIRDAFDVQ